MDCMGFRFQGLLCATLRGIRGGIMGSRVIGFKVIGL